MFTRTISDATVIEGGETQTFSRRAFLKSSGLVLGLYVPFGKHALAQGAAAPAKAENQLFPQCVCSHRQRRHGDGHLQAHRIRPGPVHRDGDAGGGRARRRLVADASRPCAVESGPLQEPAVRRARYGRLERDRQLVRADAQGRRRGAFDAGGGGRRRLACAGVRDHGRARRDFRTRPAARQVSERSRTRRPGCRSRAIRS